ncbi:MAG TPA: succinate dehydrogenase, hydrophobic membrane anchor protein [bacterium]|nr:succinate dehydrogenase, hydrophobic membrane anchor protein [bacterium]
MRAYSKPKPTGGVSLALWFYMRVSAIAMLALVLGHLYIMHVINSTDTIDFAFVAARFSTPLWRIYDMLVLFFALSHGLVGLRGILADYIGSRGWRVVAETAMWVVGFVFLIMGAIILVTFQAGAVVR